MPTKWSSFQLFESKQLSLHQTQGGSDNLSAHWTPEIRSWAVESNVGLIPTPTYASHLNRIECHFWAYVEFVVNGSDYANWSEFSVASRAYIHRRNRDRHDPRILELENRRKVA